MIFDFCWFQCGCYDDLYWFGQCMFGQGFQYVKIVDVWYYQVSYQQVWLLFVDQQQCFVIGFGCMNVDVLFVYVYQYGLIYFVLNWIIFDDQNFEVMYWNGQFGVMMCQNFIN